MKIKAGNITLNVDVCFAAMLAMLTFRQSGKDLLIYLCFAVIHECVHLICLMIFGCSEISVDLLPGGARIHGRGLSALSNRQNAVTAISAPLCNLWLAFMVWLWDNRNLQPLVTANTVLGTVNLLPLSFLDGGRTLQALLSDFCSVDELRNVAVVADICVMIILSVISLFLVIYEKKLNSLCIFCCYCFYITIKRKK